MWFGVIQLKLIVCSPEQTPAGTCRLCSCYWANSLESGHHQPACWVLAPDQLCDRAPARSPRGAGPTPVTPTSPLCTEEHFQPKACTLPAVPEWCIALPGYTATAFLTCAFHCLFPLLLGSTSRFCFLMLCQVLNALDKFFWRWFETRSIPEKETINFKIFLFLKIYNKSVFSWRMENENTRYFSF